jgi:predicted acyltransferase
MNNAPAESGHVPSSQRLMSLDMLRGFDMFWILGADSFVYALNRMSPSGPTRFLADQLEHAEWAGFRFYDLIFPLFVFIMGVSTVYSLSRLIEREGRANATRRVVKRGLLLFAIGIIYSGGFASEWPNMRLMGVLNRIALCYLFGGLIFCWCKPRAMIAIAAGLLLGYWALLSLVPIRDIRLEKDHLALKAEQAGDAALARQFRAAGNASSVNPSAIKDSPVWTAAEALYFQTTNRVTGRFETGYNLANHVDFEHLPGKKYDLFWDPEGLLSTLPAIVTGLLGIFAGLLVRNTAVSDLGKVYWLLGAGAAGVLAGFLWGTQFPVIKKIWTSSFVLVAGGYSAMLLGVFYWVVEIKQWRAWGQPFVWVGMNPITLYLISNFLGGGGYVRMARRLAGGSVNQFLNTHLAAGAGDLLVSLIGVLLFFWLARFLYRRQIFLRL